MTSNVILSHLFLFPPLPPPLSLPPLPLGEFDIMLGVHICKYLCVAHVWSCLQVKSGVSGFVFIQAIVVILVHGIF